MTLDLSEGNPTGHLILWIKHGGKNQKFKIQEIDGKFVIWSCLGSAVHVPGNTTKDGQQLAGTK